MYPQRYTYEVYFRGEVSQNLLDFLKIRQGTSLNCYFQSPALPPDKKYCWTLLAALRKGGASHIGQVLHPGSMIFQSYRHSGQILAEIFLLKLLAQEYVAQNLCAQILVETFLSQKYRP